MEKFSERLGISAKKEFQLESLDVATRNGLWNCFREDLLESLNGNSNFDEILLYHVLIVLWKDFFSYKVDDYPNTDRDLRQHATLEEFSDWFTTADWYEVYDFIEFLLNLRGSDHPNIEFADACNKILKKNLCGYHIIDGLITPIMSGQEVEAIETALEETDEWKSVNTHLKTALVLLSDRKNPDYRNSIKESISAVESLSTIITGNKSTTLGAALAEIEKTHSLHGALKTAFSALYGYTSDEGGIRHKLTEDTNEVNVEEAKFMLITCSAFINFLKAKYFSGSDTCS